MGHGHASIIVAPSPLQLPAPPRSRVACPSKRAVDPHRRLNFLVAAFLHNAGVWHSTSRRDPLACQIRNAACVTCHDVLEAAHLALIAARGCFLVGAHITSRMRRHSSAWPGMHHPISCLPCILSSTHSPLIAMLQGLVDQCISCQEDGVSDMALGTWDGASPEVSYSAQH